MEGEGAHIPGLEHAVPILLNAEGVGGIVYDFEPVLVCNALQGCGITRGAVYVNGHNGYGFFRYSRFHRCRIQVAVYGVNICKNRGKPVPNEGMGGGHKRVGCGNNLSMGKPQSLQRCDEGQGAVGKEADIGHPQVVGQGFFQ